MTSDEEADFESATVDALGVSGPVQGPASAAVSASLSVELSDGEAEKIVTAAMSAEDERNHQANALRDKFFWVVAGALGFVVLASTVVMCLYVASQWRRIEPGVMIAWMTSTVVEVIGLAYIIANYLYPAGGGTATARATITRTPPKRKKKS